MIAVDEDALICDLAETYHIYDYKQLPVKTVAVLSYGLRDDSRIKMKMTDTVAPTDIVLLTAIFDKLNILLWAQTKDAQKGRNKPKPLLDMFTQKSHTRGFDSADEFIKVRERIINQMERR